MSDFTAYRLVRSSRRDRWCCDCRRLIGGNLCPGPAIRIAGRCDDAYPGAFLTLWSCVHCLADRLPALRSKAEYTGLTCQRREAEAVAAVVELGQRLLGGAA